MTIPSKTKSHFEQILSKIYANGFHKNNQKVWIDCLKPRSLNFMCSITKILHFKNVQFLIYKMEVLSKIKPHFDAVDYFKELPFYNKSVKKSKVKRLKSIDQLAELPFYEQLSIIKTDQAFEGYVMSYKVEITERKDPIVQLEASK